MSFELNKMTNLESMLPVSKTLSALGAGGTNFNVGGSGPSDVIAYPNLYQVRLTAD